MPPMPKIQGFKNQNFSWNTNNRVKLGVKVEDTQDNSGAKILSVEEGSAADKEHFTLKAKRNNTEMNFDVKIPKPVNSADL